jgi:hypothetical protein
VAVRKLIRDQNDAAAAKAAASARAAASAGAAATAAPAAAAAAAPTAAAAVAAPPIRVVVLEVGAGLNVPTVRHESEEWLNTVPEGQVTLIRVNLDFPLCKLLSFKHGAGERTVCVGAPRT